MANVFQSFTVNVNGEFFDLTVAELKFVFVCEQLIGAFSVSIPKQILDLVDGIVIECFFDIINGNIKSKKSIFRMTFLTSCLETFSKMFVDRIDVFVN